MTDRDYMIWQLGRLGDELAARGCMLTLEYTRDALPRLWVRDPHIDQRIIVSRSDGTWWYWWPWAERITECRDAATAAERICALSRSGA